MIRITVSYPGSKDSSLDHGYYREQDVLADVASDTSIVPVLQIRDVGSAHP